MTKAPRCCCTPKSTPSAEVACPSCGCPGQPVAALTMRALLRPELVVDVRDLMYYFCATPSCPVVYYAPGVPQTFNCEDLTVRVGIKVTGPPHTICYCFGHTIESLQGGVTRTGRSEAVEAIQAAVKAGTCRCDVMNPSGRCCLGDVNKALKEITGAVVTGEVEA